MKTIFAVTYSGNIRDTSFFETKENAQAELKKIKNDRKNKLGVTVEVDTEDTFSFILGWEEARVTFRIIEIPLK